MRTIEEESKNWNEERLRDELHRVHALLKEFEQFMIEELGDETYTDICKEFAMHKSTEWMKKVGMSDDDIKEFTEQIGYFKKDLEA